MPAVVCNAATTAPLASTIVMSRIVFESLGTAPAESTKCIVWLWTTFSDADVDEAVELNVPDAVRGNWSGDDR